MGLEAATGANELGRMADRRQDARLLDGHGDEVVAAVDQEVNGNTQRQRIGTDNILDHQVGLRRLQPLPRQNGPLAPIQSRPVRHHRHALGRRQLVETGQARRLVLFYAHDLLFHLSSVSVLLKTNFGVYRCAI